MLHFHLKIAALFRALKLPLPQNQPEPPWLKETYSFFSPSEAGIVINTHVTFIPLHFVWYLCVCVYLSYYAEWKKNKKWKKENNNNNKNPTDLGVRHSRP